MTPEDVWIKVDESLDVPKGQKYNDKQLITKRTGWRTVRIFVSSTFKDFHNEREILVKEVCVVRRIQIYLLSLILFFYKTFG